MDKIKFDAAKIAGKVAVITADKDSFKEAIEKSDLTVKEVKKVNDFTKQYVDHAVMAAKEEIKKIYKGNKDVDTTKVVLPFTEASKGKIIVTSAKCAKVPVPGSKTGETMNTSKFGVKINFPLSSKYTSMVADIKKDMKSTFCK